MRSASEAQALVCLSAIIYRARKRSRLRASLASTDSTRRSAKVWPHFSNSGRTILAPFPQKIESVRWFYHNSTTLDQCSWSHLGSTLACSYFLAYCTYDWIRISFLFTIRLHLLSAQWLSGYLETKNCPVLLQTDRPHPVQTISKGNIYQSAINCVRFFVCFVAIRHGAYASKKLVSEFRHDSRNCDRIGTVHW